MNANFNPYNQWLGLAPQLLQPNYYQLLNIAVNEQDVAQVTAAAERALTRVRSFQPGGQAAEWARLLDEINAARRCLSDPASRAQYDVQLQNPVSTVRNSGTRPAPRPAAAVNNAMYPPGMEPTTNNAATPRPQDQTQQVAQAPAAPIQTYAQQPPAAQPQPPAVGRPVASPMAGYPAAPVVEQPSDPMAAFGGNGSVQNLPPNMAQVPYGQATVAPQNQVVPQTPAHPAAVVARAAVPVATPVASPTPGAPVQSTASPLAYGNAQTPGSQTAVPAGGADPMAAYQSPGAAASAPVGPTPVGTPVLAATAGSPVVGEKERDRSASEKLKRSNQQSKRTPLLLLGAGSVLGTVLIVVVLALGSNEKPNDDSGSQVAQNRPPASAIGQPSTATSGPPNSNPVDRKPSVSIDAPSQVEPPATGAEPHQPTQPNIDTVRPSMPEPETELPPFGNPPIAPSNPPAEIPATNLPSQPSAAPANPIPAKPEPAKPEPAKPEPVKPEPVKPEPEVPTTTTPAEPTKAEVAALANALKSARQAVSEYRFDDARVDLSKAAELPMLEEHKEKFERLDLASQYAENFRSALKEAVAGLDGGDSIDVGTSTVVGVVDKTANSITIRLAGMNRTYGFDDLPEGLAIAIADQWLDANEASTLVVKASFLAMLTNPRPDRLERARKWFQEAKQKNADIGDLEKVIDDSYDFDS